MLCKMNETKRSLLAPFYLYSKETCFSSLKLYFQSSFPSANLSFDKDKDGVSTLEDSVRSTNPVSNDIDGDDIGDLVE